MNKLYYSNNYYSVPDYQVEIEASRLNDKDVYTSNELVIYAARTLLAEGTIKQFILVQKGKEYAFTDYGAYAAYNNFYPDSTYDILLARILNARAKYRNNKI